MELVIQSYRNHHRPTWIQTSLDSVASWAQSSGHDYQLADDNDILSLLSSEFKSKVGQRWPMLTDLGRLLLSRRALHAGYHRVIWLDADVFIFRPELMQLPEKLADGYAFGREIWLDDRGRVRRGIHNALCVFEPNNPFLDYYIHACKRIIDVHSGENLAPQLLGPKFLKSQNSLLNMCQLDHVGMLSPYIAEHLAAGDDSALRKLQHFHQGHLAGLNLCLSMLDEPLANKVTDLLASWSAS